MDKLKLLIVDDEPLARLRLRSLLAEVSLPPVEVVDEAGSAAEALHSLARQPVDALLLDIHMPGLDGLELARRLKLEPNAPAVVFVTAYAEHALTAFEIDAVDYLTKPVRRSRLQEALQRVAQRRGQKLAAAASASAATNSAGEADAAADATLVVSDRGRVLRIPVSEVVYLKAEMKYVTLRTVRHAYVLDDALTDLEQRLGSAVLRIHRNALVARAAVRALERRPMAGAEGDEAGEVWAVRVEPVGEWLAVSRRQLPSVRDVLESGGL